jgi:hypothetical protein
VVEIDGSKSWKRKYNRGHRVKIQCTFGGVAKETGLLRHCWQDSSRVHSSDCWIMYKALEDEGYSHDNKSFDIVHESRNRS